MDDEVKDLIATQFADENRMFGGLIMPGRCYVAMRATDDIILIEQGSAPPGPFPTAMQAQMDDEKFWALNWLVTVCKNDADIEAWEKRDGWRRMGVADANQARAMRAELPAFRTMLAARVPS